MCRALKSYLVDIHLLEGSLKQFKILDVFMLQVGLELDFLDHDASCAQ